MPMMIVRYTVDDRAKWGLLLSAAPRHPDDVLSVRDLAVDARSTSELLGIIADRPDVLKVGQEVSVCARDLLSPVTDDARLVCQGLNYGSHAEEAGHAVRKANLLFAKASSSLSGPFADIVKPSDTELLDYEVEVGIILRRDLNAGAQVDAQNVGEYVAAVVLCNDVSARDVMFGASFFQWFQGKSYRTFCPTGPVLYVLEAEEASETLDALEITLSLNGEMRQSAATRDWVFKPAETLTQIATIMDLRRGDMVLTGTPGGVIAQGTPAIFEIFRQDLFNDAHRRDALRDAFQSAARFLQQGDELALTLRDTRSGVDLGGQFCAIVDAGR